MDAIESMSQLKPQENLNPKETNEVTATAVEKDEDPISDVVMAETETDTEAANETINMEANEASSVPLTEIVDQQMTTAETAAHCDN